MLEVGSKAPDFTLDDQDGNPVSLSNFKGQKVLLWFIQKPALVDEQLKDKCSVMSIKIFKKRTLKSLV